MGCEKCKIIGKVIDFDRLKKPGKNIEHKENNEVTIEQMWNKAETVKAKTQVNPEDFYDVYEEIVDKDIAKVEELINKYNSTMDKNSRECKMYADVLEALIEELINYCGLLGLNAEGRGASKFDDLFGHIDEIIDLDTKNKGTKILGLGVDATYSGKIDEKIRGIKAGIAKGELAKIKYFESGNFKGQLSQVPHLVVGVSLGKIKELGKMWVNGDMEGLKNHPVQYQILEEMIIQLETYEKYAIKYDKEDLAQVYRDNCEILKNIKAEKEKVLPDAGERDHIFESIKKEMEKFMNDRRR